MKDYIKSIVTVIGLSCVCLTLGASNCSVEDDFSSEAVLHFNHEGYQNASMEDDCKLQESFDVAECDADEGCNIIRAAASKATFASLRYSQASDALTRSASVYKDNGYNVTAKLLELAAKDAESGHLAFKALGAFGEDGFEVMNVSSYEDLKEVFLHVDPVYLDSCKSIAKALASAVATNLFVREIVEASAYHQSASAAAFRAYQFFYAGTDNIPESTESESSDGSLTSWIWGMMGY